MRMSLSIARVCSAICILFALTSVTSTPAACHTCCNEAWSVHGGDVAPENREQSLRGFATFRPKRDKDGHRVVDVEDAFFCCRDACEDGAIENVDTCTAFLEDNDDKLQEYGFHQCIDMVNLRPPQLPERFSATFTQTLHGSINDKSEHQIWVDAETNKVGVKLVKVKNFRIIREHSHLATTQFKSQISFADGSSQVDIYDFSLSVANHYSLVSFGGEVCHIQNTWTNLEFLLAQFTPPSERVSVPGSWGEVHQKYAGVEEDVTSHFDADVWKFWYERDEFSSEQRTETFYFGQNIGDTNFLLKVVSEYHHGASRDEVVLDFTEFSDRPFDDSVFDFPPCDAVHTSAAALASFAAHPTLVRADDASTTPGAESTFTPAILIVCAALVAVGFLGGAWIISRRKQ